MGNQDSLDARTLALSDLDRVPLINALIRIDANMQAVARAKGRSKRNSVDRYHAEEARANSDRLGRIIYFLRFRSPATDTARQDSAVPKIGGKASSQGPVDG